MKSRLIPCLCLAGLCGFETSAIAGEIDPELQLYGSWRLHGTAASVDAAAPGQDNSYVGVSDAYSRIGAKGSFLAGGTKFSAKLELGLNTADFETGDPSFFDDEDFRIKSITATGNWGTLRAGKDWLPYYNAVGYPVDYFSSIYAGYSTYAYFREVQLTYITPEFNGVKGSLSRIKRTGGGPMGWHYTASYAQNGLMLAAGMEDMDGDLADTYGASASLSRGQWYGAVKYEHNDAAGDICHTRNLCPIGCLAQPCSSRRPHLCSDHHGHCRVRNCRRQPTTLASKPPRRPSPGMRTGPRLYA